MDYFFLLKTKLFQGVSADEAQKMMTCLNAVEKKYTKDETIYHAGTAVESLGLVMTGSVHIESFGFDGKKIILSQVPQGHLFAETYACIPGERLLVTVTAAEDTTVLFLNARRLLTSCANTCSFHTKLISNLLAVSAQKNLNLSLRILHTSQKTIRGRLESYLASEAQKQDSRNMVIPFDRQQLADYLNVDRSALSHELGKMESEGILTVKKNRFTLLKQDTL